MATSNIWQTYSVFISSTFADMQLERDHLKNEIFPRIDDELRERRIKLDVVDLRWGVDTASLQQEDEREATVLKVCLNEIKQSKPFFIGLLGDRYGWVPKEERMKKAIEENGADIKPKGKSVTALEIEFGVLASKEQLKRSFFYFRKPFDYMKLPEEKRGMFCDEYNNELTPAEKAERKTALYKLKTDIREYFKKAPQKVKEYSIDWGKSAKENVGLKEWGEEVYKDILKDAEKYAEVTWNEVPKNWEEREQALLGEFVNDHIYGFCGRTNLLEKIKQHLLNGSNENWGLVLTGESGSGKSSVFAKIYDELVKENGDYFILTHSAGISPRSKNVADLLQIWIRQLWDFLEYKGDPLEEFEQKENSQFEKLGFGEQEKPKLKIDELQNKFTGLLFKATEKKRLIVLIDALDRFETTARAKYMSWFPSIVPQNLRMLCTAITGTEKNTVEYHKGLDARSIDNFSPEEAKDMLTTLCKIGHKDLSLKVSEAILSKKRGDSIYASSSPLWLSLAVNIMMALDKDDFEKMSKVEGRADAGMESYMTEMIKNFPPLPGDLFINLINKARILFGEDITKAVFNLIAISRNGLREKDLEKLVSNWEPLQYASLRRWFRAHLIKQSEELQWNFAHSVLRNTLIDKIEKDNYKKLNDLIAAHLLKQPNTDALHISETMYHLMEANNKQKAAEYYSGVLTEDETAGATKVLAEAIIGNKSEYSNPMLKWITRLLDDRQLKPEIITGLCHKYLTNLSLELSTTGNFKEMEILLGRTHRCQLLKGNSMVIKDALKDAIYGIELAQIYLERGLCNFAAREFNTWNKELQVLHKESPKSYVIKYHLAHSYSKIGDISYIEGKYDEAKSFYEKQLAIYEDLKETDSNLFYDPNTFYNVYHRLGKVYKKIGDIKKAKEFYSSEFSIIKNLLNIRPDDFNLKILKANSCNEQALLHEIDGDHNIAENLFKESIAIILEVQRSNPGNELFNFSLTNLYNSIGQFFNKQNRNIEAKNCFEMGNEILKRLTENNPINENIKRHYAFSFENLSDCCKEVNDIPKAIMYISRSGSLFEELSQINPNNIELKQGYSNSYRKLGELAEIIGDLEKAIELYAIGYKTLQEVYSLSQMDQEIKLDYSLLVSALGKIYVKKRCIEVANKYFCESEKLFEELLIANEGNVLLIEKISSINYEVGEVFINIECNSEGINYLKKAEKLLHHIYVRNNSKNIFNKIESIKKFIRSKGESNE